MQRARRATEVLFGAEIQGMPEDELLDVFADVPLSELPEARLSGLVPLVDVLVEAACFKSKGEAKRMIDGGGVYVNNQRVGATSAMASHDMLATRDTMVVRKGRKDYRLIRFTPDAGHVKGT